MQELIKTGARSTLMEQRGAMEYGLREVAALAASGAVGALLIYGYQKWIKQ